MARVCSPDATKPRHLRMPGLRFAERETGLEPRDIQLGSQKAPISASAHQRARAQIAVQRWNSRLSSFCCAGGRCWTPARAGTDSGTANSAISPRGSDLIQDSLIHSRQTTYLRACLADFHMVRAVAAEVLAEHPHRLTLDGRRVGERAQRVAEREQERLPRLARPERGRGACARPSSRSARKTALSDRSGTSSAGSWWTASRRSSEAAGEECRPGAGVPGTRPSSHRIPKRTGLTQRRKGTERRLLPVPPRLSVRPVFLRIRYHAPVSRAGRLMARRGRTGKPAAGSRWTRRLPPGCSPSWTGCPRCRSRSAPGWAW